MAAGKLPLKYIGAGVGGLLVGLFIAFIGFSVIGRGDGAAVALAAGTVSVIGITVALLSVFLLILPPLLPSR